jgi:hypothetical protein
MASKFGDRAQIEGSPKLSTNSGPVAWQWLDTAHFRKIVPAGAEAGAWRPLYARPAPSVEPVAWMHHYVDGEDTTWAVDGISDPLAHCDTRWTWVGCSPIYSTPPDHREVMQQAIEALRNAHAYSVTHEEFEDGVLDVIDTLRAALGERDE